MSEDVVEFVCGCGVRTMLVCDPNSPVGEYLLGCMDKPVRARKRVLKIFTMHEGQWMQVHDEWVTQARHG